MEKNRKTTIPVQTSPAIVVWLTKNCSIEELEFMAELAGSSRKFGLFSSILTRLTDRNIHDVFYESDISTAEELLMFRAAKRGEVAGLKAFQRACQIAKEELAARRKKK